MGRACRSGGGREAATTVDTTGSGPSRRRRPRISVSGALRDDGIRAGEEEVAGSNPSRRSRRRIRARGSGETMGSVKEGKRSPDRLLPSRSTADLLLNLDAIALSRTPTRCLAGGAVAAADALNGIFSRLNKSVSTEEQRLESKERGTGRDRMGERERNSERVRG